MAEPSDFDPPRDPSRLTVGERFERYDILRLLGRGSLGTTYLALDESLERDVALKVFNFAGSEVAAHRTRFLQEARAAASLCHPGFCQVLDAGEGDGRLYLTQTYIDGEPVSDVLRSRVQSLRMVVGTVTLVALALRDAHSLGFLHLNLKPSNIILNPRHGPVIVDLGMSRVVDPDAATLTNAAPPGFIAYMSPEQLRGDAEGTGTASDVYSLGVILYEWLSGRHPFVGTTAEVIAQVLVETPPPPSAFRPGLDAALDVICLKALAREVEDRYSSMDELHQALEHWLTLRPDRDFVPLRDRDFDSLMLNLRPWLQLEALGVRPSNAPGWPPPVFRRPDPPCDLLRRPRPSRIALISRIRGRGGPRSGAS